VTLPWTRAKAQEGPPDCGDVCHPCGEGQGAPQTSCEGFVCSEQDFPPCHTGPGDRGTKKCVPCEEVRCEKDEQCGPTCVCNKSKGKCERKKKCFEECEQDAQCSDKTRCAGDTPCPECNEVYYGKKKCVPKGCFKECGNDEDCKKISDKCTKCKEEKSSDPKGKCVKPIY
jgi:hypothetical protein